MLGLSGDHMTFFGLVEPGYTLQERTHWVKGKKVLRFSLILALSGVVNPVCGYCSFLFSINSMTSFIIPVNQNRQQRDFNLLPLFSLLLLVLCYTWCLW